MNSKFNQYIRCIIERSTQLIATMLRIVYFSKVFTAQKHKQYSGTLSSSSHTQILAIH